MLLRVLLILMFDEPSTLPGTGAKVDKTDIGVEG